METIDRLMNEIQTMLNRQIFPPQSNFRNFKEFCVNVFNFPLENNFHHMMEDMDRSLVKRYERENIRNFLFFFQSHINRRGSVSLEDVRIKFGIMKELVDGQSDELQQLRSEVVRLRSQLGTN